MELGWGGRRHRALRPLIPAPWGPPGLRVLSVLACRTDVPGPGSAQAPGRYRNWNPPLLGNLPEDFLRILPQQAPRAQVRAPPRPGAEPPAAPTAGAGSFRAALERARRAGGNFQPGSEASCH